MHSDMIAGQGSANVRNAGANQVGVVQQPLSRGSQSMIQTRRFGQALADGNEASLTIAQALQDLVSQERRWVAALRTLPRHFRNRHRGGGRADGSGVRNMFSEHEDRRLAGRAEGRDYGLSF